MAFGALSFTNASTSAGVGGRPIRSRDMRRIRVWRLAGGEGLRFSLCSRASTNWSMGFFAQLASATLGGAVGRGGANDQCCWYVAPDAIQRRSTTLCAAVNAVFVEGAGTTMSRSPDDMRQ